MRARGGAQAGRHQTAVGLGLESDPVAGKGTGPTGGTHLSARGRGKEEEQAVHGRWAGEAAGPRGGERKRGEGRGPGYAQGGREI
jgi:hypothetical protein